MKSNKLTVRISKPAPVVYNFYINPRNTPRWISSIVTEETSEWPIRVGTVYRNLNKAGIWSDYVVTNLKQNQVFELASGNRNYHVRYTHKPIDKTSSELEYYEWVDQGGLSEPFTQDILEKLKEEIEKR